MLRASKALRWALLLLLAAAAVGGPRPTAALKGPVFGCRVPRKYFVARGFGETDEGSGMDPFETGAHDLAMEDAGIHEFNLVQYTSILPKQAREISIDEARQTPGWQHGAVLECIMSQVHGARGDRVTAGVGRMMVHKKGDTDAVMGGFATEYKGHAAPELAEKELKEALEELFERRFSPKDHEMGTQEFAIVSETVTKSFAEAIAAVCFVDYIFPSFDDPEHAEL